MFLGQVRVTLILNALIDFFFCFPLGATLLKTLDFPNLWPSQSTDVSLLVPQDLL
jgi:hypothetical protein